MKKYAIIYKYDEDVCLEFCTAKDAKQAIRKIMIHVNGDDAELTNECCADEGINFNKASLAELKYVLDVWGSVLSIAEVDTEKTIYEY